MQQNINIVNKKAKFKYFLNKKYIAGLVLNGSEIKSIRLKNVNLESSYCSFNNNELYVKHLEKIVPKFHNVYSGNSLVKELFEVAGYPVFVPELINREAWQGVSIRQAMKDGDDWEMNVPPSVAKIISEIDLS